MRAPWSWACCWQLLWVEVAGALWPCQPQASSPFLPYLALEQPQLLVTSLNSSLLQWNCHMLLD